MAQSLGVAQVLCQGRGDGCGRRPLGKMAAHSERPRHSMGMAHSTPPRVSVVAAALAPGSVLRVFRGVWFGPDFSSSLVAALLVQHALRTGASTGVCSEPGVLLALC